MDIEEFYAADERRRRSPEVEFGREWRDRHGVRFELSWVEDTGELYVMREPVPAGWADPFGGIHVRGSHEVDEQEVDGMSVVVIGTVTARADVEAALEGWEAAMAREDSVAWLVDRLRTRAILGPADPGSPLVT